MCTDPEGHIHYKHLTSDINVILYINISSVPMYEGRVVNLMNTPNKHVYQLSHCNNRDSTAGFNELC